DVCSSDLSPGFLPISKLPKTSSMPKYSAPFKVAQLIPLSRDKFGKWLKRVFNSDRMQSLSLDAKLSVPRTTGNRDLINKSTFGKRFSIYKLALGQRHQVTSRL